MENSHWWYLIRKEYLRNWVKRLKPGSLILDIGSATGGNTLALRQLGFDVTSLEYSKIGVSLQLQKGIDVIWGDAREMPFSDDTFNAIICLDVLEHISEDATVLAEARRVLRPGGHFLFSVPEDPKLWSSHDEAVHHVRRYTREELTVKVQKAGFSTTHVWSTNVLLRPLIKITRKFTSGSNAGPVNPILNFALLQISRVEAKLRIGGRRGVTLWAEGILPVES